MTELNPSSTTSRDDVAEVQWLHDQRDKLLAELAKRIVGQKEIIQHLLYSLFCGGHCLLVGVPGLAKTLLIRTFAQVLDLKFKRIQFTPDLMPSDITGTDILEESQETGHRQFRFLQGPVFANVILADEINRTPPKTQAALLEAMQEYQVTAGGNRYLLEKPFFVLATQNPIEQEGTYPLPEAQLDRFMFEIHVEYPELDAEVEIVKTTTSAYDAQLRPVLTGAEILRIQELVRRVPVDDAVIQYAVRLVRASRPSEAGVLTDTEQRQYISQYVNWGAGPRASQYLILGAKARAILEGRYVVIADDVRALALPVLRHRVLTNFRAEADGVSSEQIIQHLLEWVQE